MLTRRLAIAAQYKPEWLLDLKWMLDPDFEGHPRAMLKEARAQIECALLALLRLSYQRDAQLREILNNFQHDIYKNLLAGQDRFMIYPYGQIVEGPNGFEGVSVPDEAAHMAAMRYRQAKHYPLYFAPEQVPQSVFIQIQLLMFAVAKRDVLVLDPVQAVEQTQKYENLIMALVAQADALARRNAGARDIFSRYHLLAPRCMFEFGAGFDSEARCALVHAAVASVVERLELQLDEMPEEFLPHHEYFMDLLLFLYEGKLRFNIELAKPDTLAHPMRVWHFKSHEAIVWQVQLRDENVMGALDCMDASDWMHLFYAAALTGDQGVFDVDRNPSGTWSWPSADDGIHVWLRPTSVDRLRQQLALRAGDQALAFAAPLLEIQMLKLTRPRLRIIS